MFKHILVTGGTGYIGSHAIVQLIQSGYTPIIIDNLCNSSKTSLQRVEKIVGCKVIFEQGDIRNYSFVDSLFNKYPISTVLHFAGLKAVGESVKNPINYYDNNVIGSLNLLKVMAGAGVFTLVYSSSATVYGNPKKVPISESEPTGNPTNPYGQSKLITEKILEDLAKADLRWRIAILRYFNPLGAHQSGLIGEDPNGIPDNLVPYISKVAVGKLAKLSIFGDDYPTPDGTGIRDYIHVVDLVVGHIKAIEFLKSKKGVHIWNLGTGIGYSVFDVIKVFEKVSGQSVSYKITQRRQGDVAICYADPKKAQKDLDWKVERDLETMIRDAWRWQLQNPDGYKS